jgi:hypothetical protein
MRTICISLIAAHLRHKQKETEQLFRERFRPKAGGLAIIILAIMAWACASGLVFGFIALVRWVIMNETI